MAELKPIDYQNACTFVARDPRFLKNIEYGIPRDGHPEGKVKNHIEHLQELLIGIMHLISLEEYWRLKLAIMTHDSFKMESQRNVRTTDYNSHGSIAARYLFDLVVDPGLAAVVQYHDEPFAIFRKQEHTSRFDQERWQKFWDQIVEKRLFVIFHMLDGSTPGKKPERIIWFHHKALLDNVTWVKEMFRAVREASVTLGGHK